MFDFDDINVNLLAGHAAEFFLQLVDFRAFAADSSFFFSSSRISRSSVNNLPNSFLPAYHFERQSRVTATRKPTGLVFWPILERQSPKFKNSVVIHQSK